MTKILLFRTWISLRPVGQSWSNFMCSITGSEERLHNVLRQTGSKLWCPWQQKHPLTYKGKNGVSTFSRLLLIRSFLHLQVTRTCIISRTSSNFGQIGPLTTELAALIMGNGVSMLARSIFIKSSSKLLVTRTGIKAWSSSLLGRIRPLILELLALEWQNFTLLNLNISEANWPILI